METTVGDRIAGLLMQLISCLQVILSLDLMIIIILHFQCRKCPHYFIPSVDLLKGKSPSSMDKASKATWNLMRDLITNSKAFETL